MAKNTRGEVENGLGEDDRLGWINGDDRRSKELSNVLTWLLLLLASGEAAILIINHAEVRRDVDTERKNGAEE